MAPVKTLFKMLKPHIAIVAGFAMLSLLYFYPEFSGKQIRQSDMTKARGMAQELVNYEKQNPKEVPLWTNSMFSGMPTYLIKLEKTYNVFTVIRKILSLGMNYYTSAIVFIALISFYILMQVIGLNRWYSVAGAIGFAFASYNIIIIAAGHITKAYSIAFMPLSIAGLLLIWQQKYKIGTLLTIFGVGLLVSQSHPQIAYYTFIIILIFFISHFFYVIKQNQLKHYFISGVIAIIASVIAILPYSVNLLTIADYSKHSIRGPSELTKNDNDKSSGLDRDYAYQWSYGPAEAFSILVPNFVGAGVNGFNEKSKTAEQLKSVGVNSEVARQLPVYWGKLPFTVGPAYFGAIICFLFILGLFLVRGPVKWWLFSAALLSILLSWGKNFSTLSDLFFYYFPLYNKFRTVDMILVIANFVFPLLGFWALKEISEKKYSIQEIFKAFKYTVYILGGLLLVFILFPGWFFSFNSLSDEQLIQQLKAARWPDNVIENLLAAMRDDRMQILRADAFRSLIYIAIAAGLLWWYVKKSIRIEYFAIPLALLILIDLWSVDRRYLNKDYFVPKHQTEFIKSVADEFILADKDIHYRVLNLSRSTFNDGYTSYFHKSIGGYHGAKLRRYQDMIDGPLMSDIVKVQQYLSVYKKFPDSTFYKQLPILNMLNCKYIIYNPEAQPLINTERYGNAWFVKEIKWVNNADEEYAAVSDTIFNPLQKVVIDQKWKQAMKGFEECVYNENANITLTQYKPHQLTYAVNTPTSQIIAFSEVFYPNDWKVYINGKPASHARANYIIRTMVVPAGSHIIEFKFEPYIYSVAQKLSISGSVIIILLTLGMVAWHLRQK